MGTSQKEAIHSSGALMLGTVAQETLQTSWSGGQQGYDGDPTGLYILTYIESCCLRTWLLVSLKLGAQ